MTAEELQRAAPCLYELALATARNFHESPEWEFPDTALNIPPSADIPRLEKIAAEMLPDEIEGITNGASQWYNDNFETLEDIRPGLSRVDVFLADMFY